MVRLFVFNGSYGRRVIKWCKSHEAAAFYQAEQEVKPELTYTETTQVTKGVPKQTRQKFSEKYAFFNVGSYIT